MNGRTRQIVLLLIIVGFTTYGNTSVIGNDVENSEINVTSALTQNSTTLIEIVVKNSTNDFVEGAAVTLTAPFGTFQGIGTFDEVLSENQLYGETSGSGTLVVNWTSPVLPGNESEIEVEFAAYIEIAEDSISISTTTTVSNDISVVSNSNLIIPESGESNETVDVITQVLDEYNQIQSGFFISHNISEGEILTSEFGESDNTGTFTTAVRLPILDITRPTAIIYVESSITVNENISLKLTGTITMSIENSSSIVVAIDYPNSIKEASSTTISVTVETNESKIEGAEITAYVSGGTMENSTGITNQTGILAFNWEAPILTELSNLTVGMIFDIQYLNYSELHEIDILVVPIIDSYEILSNFSKTTYYQNETLILNIEVRNEITFLPASNVKVSLISEVGYFTGQPIPGPTIELFTDENGSITTNLNVSSVNFVKEISEITVNGYFSSEKSLVQEFNVSTSIIRIQLAQISITGTVDVLDDGNFEFSVFASDLSGNRVNITIEGLSTAGNFLSTNSSFVRGSTNSNGEVVFILLPNTNLLEELNTSVTFSAITPEFDGNLLEFVIIMEPSSERSTINTATTNNDPLIEVEGTDENSQYIIIGSAVLASGIGTGSAVFIIRRRR